MIFLGFDKTTKKRIRKILRMKKLSMAFRQDFIFMLRANDDERLEDMASYLVKGNPNPVPDELNYIVSDVYTARTTYERLVELVEHPNLYYFDKSRRVHVTVNIEED